MRLVTAVLFLNGAVLKLTGGLGSPGAFDALGLGLGLGGMYLAGAAELAGGIGPLIPRLPGPAALCFVPMTAVAVVLEVTVHGPARGSGALGALVAVSLLARYLRGSADRLVRQATAAGPGTAPGRGRRPAGRRPAGDGYRRRAVPVSRDRMTSARHGRAARSRAGRTGQGRG